VVHNTALNSSDNLTTYPPENQMSTGGEGTTIATAVIPLKAVADYDISGLRQR